MCKVVVVRHFQSLLRAGAMRKLHSEVPEEILKQTNSKWKLKSIRVGDGNSWRDPTEELRLDAKTDLIPARPSHAVASLGVSLAGCWEVPNDDHRLPGPPPPMTESTPTCWGPGITSDPRLVGRTEPVILAVASPPQPQDASETPGGVTPPPPHRADGQDQRT